MTSEAKGLIGASSLLGATTLMNPYLLQKGIDLRKIEEEMIDGDIPARDDIDYDKKIAELAGELGLDFSSGDLKAPPRMLNPSGMGNTGNEPSKRTKPAEGIINIDDMISIRSGGSHKSRASHGSKRSRCSHCTVKLEEEVAAASVISPMGTDRVPYRAGTAGAMPPSNEPSPLLRGLTEEQEKKIHMSKVIQTMRGDTRTAFTNEAERDQSDKINKLEQIDSLKTSLEEERIDTSSIPSLTIASSMQEIDSVLTLLLMKSNRTRYSTLAKEFISGVAESIESVFDGTRAIPVLGWKPDYTGYENTVAVKLNRMKFETSQVVGSVLDGGSVSPWSRILLELIPSFLLYPRTRAKQTRPSRPIALSSSSSSHAFNHIRSSEDNGGNSWANISSV